MIEAIFIVVGLCFMAGGIIVLFGLDQPIGVLFFIFGAVGLGSGLGPIINSNDSKCSEFCISKGYDRGAFNTDGTSEHIYKKTTIDGSPYYCDCGNNEDLDWTEVKYEEPKEEKNCTCKEVCK